MFCGSPIPSLPKKLTCWSLSEIDISVHDSTGINVTKEPCVSGLLETEVRDNFMKTGTPKMFCCNHGGPRVKVSRWPFCGRIPGPTDTIWASSEG